MIKLQYKLDHPNYTDYHYNIIQLRAGDPYQFFRKDTLIGGIQKVNGTWKQTSGRETLDSIVESIGKFIEENS